MINEENMQIWKWLTVGISTVSVVLLILTSISNVVGYQTVQSSNQSVIKDRINQRELLFQTICDIVNNKEIQRITLKSQMSRGIFPPSEFPVVTKTHIRQIYLLGLLLSRFTRTSRIQSMIGKYQFDNQEVRKEISAVIENDAILKAELTQLKDSDCNCDNKDSTQWCFPILCVFLYPLLVISVILLLLLSYYPYYDFMESLAKELICFWAQPG
jgi:hypothetical protein